MYDLPLITKSLEL